MKEQKNKSKANLPCAAFENAAKGAQAPRITMDWEAYASHLEGHDLTNDEKRELIEALMQIVMTFIDLGFEVTSPDSLVEAEKLTIGEGKPPQPEL